MHQVCVCVFLCLVYDCLWSRRPGERRRAGSFIDFRRQLSVSGGRGLDRKVHGVLLFVSRSPYVYNERRVRPRKYRSFFRCTIWPTVRVIRVLCFILILCIEPGYAAVRTRGAVYAQRSSPPKTTLLYRRAGFYVSHANTVF